MSKTPYSRPAPQAIAEWLRSLPLISNVVPLTIEIAGTTYPAASYRQTMQTPFGSRAYLNGEREYTCEMIYAEGMLPKAYLRSSHIAFSMTNDSREWYIAAYYGDKTNRRQNVCESTEYHPFGNSFLLSPWDAERPIDHYNDKPYRRVAISVVHWKG